MVHTTALPYCSGSVPVCGVLPALYSWLATSRAAYIRGVGVSTLGHLLVGRTFLIAAFGIGTHRYVSPRARPVRRRWATLLPARQRPGHLGPPPGSFCLQWAASRRFHQQYPSVIDQETLTR